MNFTPQQRASIVANYFASGMTQKKFCADRKLSARTLRSWMRQHAPRPKPVAELLADIDHLSTAVEALRARVANTWQPGPPQDDPDASTHSGAPLGTMPLSKPDAETTRLAAEDGAGAPQPVVPPPGTKLAPQSSTSGWNTGGAGALQLVPPDTSVTAATVATEAACPLPTGIPDGVQEPVREQFYFDG